MTTENIISLKAVKASQRNGLVLDGVELNVSKGEFVYIIGKTGSGKSSLLKVLYKELDIESGEASILDFNLNSIKNRDVSKLRKSLGIVFQDFQLLRDRTIEENLFFVMRSTGWKSKKLMKKHIDEMLQQVNLPDAHKKYPHQLSGGEQQRVVIARAMINAPKVILADEPTGNLDPESSREIMQLLKQISAAGTTILMATHDMDIIKEFPSRTMVCDQGKLSEQV